MERTPVYCQNCRSQNSLRDTHCQNCGTRLLLVVFPQSLQYDTNHVPSFYEDHLLERVSLLELRLVQMSESLRIAMEIVREQGKIVKENQRQLRALNKKLSGSAGQKIVEEAPETGARHTTVVEQAVAEHDSPNVELFTKILNEGIRLLEDREEKEAFRMLERALLLSPRNQSLLFFTARSYFSADRFADAKKHLEKAFELAPENENVLLLSGTIYADEGDTERARLFLSILAEQERTSLVVNLVWGLLAAFEGKLTESLAAFKLASEKAEIAELEYLTGAVFFEQKDLAAASRHFLKAVSIDPQYADAGFMQAVVYYQLDEKDLAKIMVENVSAIREAGAQCAESLRKNKLDLETALPFQHFRKKDARLLTGGALRLTRFLKNEIEKAIA